MRGIDIIEALNDIDDKLLRDARPTRRAAPVWLKYGSLAACLCCAVLLAGLSIHWLFGDTPQPMPLTSGYEEPGSTPVTLESARYGLSLTVEERFVDNIQVDTPIHIEFENEDIVDSQDVIFSFYDHFSEESQMDGLVWYIIPVEKDRFDYEEYEQRKNYVVAITNTILATDDKYVYTLIHSGWPDNYCYESSDYDSVYAYWLSTQESYNIIGKFITENGLDPDPDWKQRFTDYTVAPVESNLAAFNETAAIEGATVTLRSEKYPVTLTLPEEYADNVMIDTPFIDDGTDFDNGIVMDNVVFSFHANYDPQDPSENMVWLIYAYHLNGFDIQNFENDFKGVAFQFSQTFIGTDDQYVYLIFHPGLPEYFYDHASIRATEEYLLYLQAGKEILMGFASENQLTADADWPEIYEALTIAPVEDNLAKLTSNNRFIYPLMSYSSPYDSDENRTNNLALACQAIDGTVLHPGEEFSFNDVVGQRTAEKGYLEAGTYSGGDSETAIGGGISQVSSALYYCCLYADLEITERHSHIFQPTWVPGGMDAAVYWGSQDFRFFNNTEHAITITAYLSDECVYVELLSTEAPQFTVEIQTTSMVDDALASYSLTRHVYDAEGNLSRTDSWEDLNAMGGLGETIYTRRQDATEATSETTTENAAAPTAEVQEYPAYVLMEEDLVSKDGVRLTMFPSEVLAILGEPEVDEIYGENDMFRSFDYGNSAYFFTYCDACDDYHLIHYGIDGEDGGIMPFGFPYGTPLEEVLAYFDAEDMTPSYSSYLYRLDNEHWATYAPVAETGLVYIVFCVGDMSYTINFNRNNQIHASEVAFSTGQYLCPHAE